MIRVSCPYCKSSGYISPPPPQTILMGPCPICGEPVALYNTRVIGLKQKLEGAGDSGEKIQSLARVIMEYINSHAGPVDEDGIERLIQETDAPFDKSDAPTPESVLNVSPSIRNSLDSPITSDEVEDFFKIDINLLGGKDYFEQHFG
jgi:hypothetical protein